MNTSAQKQYPNVDPQLWKTPSDTFHNEVYTRAGPGLFRSKETAQEIMKDLKELSFRITPSSSPNTVTVWVNKVQFANWKQGKQREADEISMKEFRKWAPLYIFIILAGSAVVGLLAMWTVEIIGKLVNLKTDPTFTFLLFALISLLMGTARFVITAFNKGRS